MGCSKKCLTEFGYRDDDISKSENVCLQNCFHKYYRYMAYSNTLYSFLISTEKDTEEHMPADEEMTPDQIYVEMQMEEKRAMAEANQSRE
jgi:hypothetical protein